MREARAAEHLESSGKQQEDCEKTTKKVVTVVGVKTKETGKAPPALPRTPYPRAPPVAPPPPSPLLAANTLPDASDRNTKLDLRGIRQGALLRDIQKQGSADRDFVEPRKRAAATISKNNRVVAIENIQWTNFQVHSPRAPLLPVLSSHSSETTALNCFSAIHLLFHLRVGHHADETASSSQKLKAVCRQVVHAPPCQAVLQLRHSPVTCTLREQLNI